MIAADLTNQMIPPLRLSDPARVAMDWMDEFRVSQLPVVEGKDYLGLIADFKLLDISDEEILIKEVDLEHAQIFARYDQHFLDVLRLADQHQLEVVPVLDDDDNYEGIISIKDTISAVTKLLATQIDGGIIVISLYQRDYSLSEISRLIEAEGVMIVSTFIESDSLDASKIKLSIKVNKQELGRVIATLERFGYTIIAKFQNNKERDMNQDRLELLLRYLDV